MATIDPIIVSTNQSKNPSPQEAGVKPEHWVDLKGSTFQNPWPSWRTTHLSERFGLLPKFLTLKPPAREDKDSLTIRTPTWGAEETEVEEKIKSTWLGHACFLVELPRRTVGQRGARILFDPVFSARCFANQWIGPKRFTPAPCKIEEIPDIDAIVISHNHYDHLDTHTIDTLFKRKRVPHIFAPLGNGPYFKSLGIPESHTHIMDWWDSKRVEVDLQIDETSKAEGKAQKVTFDITCTPGQHFTGRTLLDNFKSLWASWVVEEVLPSLPTETESTSRPATKVFFAGDTGYRAVMDGQDEDKVPTCPVFKEIGARFGGFDFAMIPIGAYMPRQFMSPIHCAPQDSVRLFKDVRARKALGMHWATWVLTTEHVLEPPKRLAEECKKVGIEDGDFTVCDIGQTRLF